MSESLPADLESDIGEFEGLLDKIENQLEPYFKHSLKDHQDELSPLQAAQLDISVAYALNSLFYMYLQTQGVSPHGHQVKGELDRIKHYIVKLQGMNTQQEIDKPKMTVDTEASKRMINHSLNANQPSNKEKEQKKRKK
ncbi:hypothetical protein SAMD00019534_102330 [Acytostelium subglobosum LB1]|uniref:hypothetical protein n=1 Tax=Acytostelium subglobosum LB1 TaxID=1410327 RepID=UPI000644CD1D|nr:hypothetical protein SAMD00019534_102330 [Acytostelium subglobosum LB1]GAM27058.1 hypothetical protein SAMD00019534_102330 [Acytostelium subglobosum LB1]|eukprot:XP_012749938.1 hypothetical protein SAMD00019534_102330 [Acytostelium subglobosum LB1]